MAADFPFSVNIEALERLVAEGKAIKQGEKTYVILPVHHEELTMKRDIEKEALTHALAALDDGSGHDVWGPGPIGFKLWEKKHAKAATAFDLSAQSAIQLGHTDRGQMIAVMRAVAPVFYELIANE